MKNFHFSLSSTTSGAFRPFNSGKIEFLARNKELEVDEFRFKRISRRWRVVADEQWPWLIKGELLLFGFREIFDVFGKRVISFDANKQRKGRFGCLRRWFPFRCNFEISWIFYDFLVNFKVLFSERVLEISVNSWSLKIDEKFARIINFDLNVLNNYIMKIIIVRKTYYKFGSKCDSFLLHD